jgi:hypothetical protein
MFHRLLLLLPLATSFVPPLAPSLRAAPLRLSPLVDVASSVASAAPHLPGALSSLASFDLPPVALAFADQSGKLAGTFFASSLFPYLIFLYFLGYKRNSTPPLAQFGFGYLLLFVLGTIPAGIVAKASYGFSLADCDWLHGGAEALLTVTSLLVVAGMRDASVEGGIPFVKENEGLLKKGALGLGAVFFGFCFLGPSLLGFGGHSDFLFGVGDVSSYLPGSVPFAAEPENALSVPTWAIHFSSVFEWLFAMAAVWRFSEVTGNDSWKGLT